MRVVHCSIFSGSAFVCIPVHIGTRDSLPVRDYVFIGSFHNSDPEDTTAIGLAGLEAGNLAGFDVKR